MKILKNYVDAMFKEMPETRDILDLKQSILESMEQKYEDLLAEGKNESEALGTVISQFGDIEELKEAYGFEEKNPSKKGIFIDEDGVHIESKERKIQIGNDSGIKIRISDDEEIPPRKRKSLFTEIGTPLAVAVYLFLGFDRGLWHPGWVVIPITAMMMESIDKWIFSHKPFYKKLTKTIESLAMSIFFIAAFVYGAWHPGWLILVIGWLLNQLVRNVFRT